MIQEWVRILLAQV